MKQTSLKEVSPLLQKIINWSSIIGAFATLCILHLGLLFWHPSIQRNLVSFYSPSRHLWSTSLYLSSDPSDSGPYYSRRPDICSRCFIYGHIIGTIYNYIGIVIGCAIIFHLARMYGPKFVQSMVSQKTYDKYIGWLNEGKRFDRFLFS